MLIYHLTVWRSEAPNQPPWHEAIAPSRVGSFQRGSLPFLASADRPHSLACDPSLHPSNLVSVVRSHTVDSDG